MSLNTRVMLVMGVLLATAAAHAQSVTTKNLRFEDLASCDDPGLMRRVKFAGCETEKIRAFCSILARNPLTDTTTDRTLQCVPDALRLWTECQTPEVARAPALTAFCTSATSRDFKLAADNMDARDTIIEAGERPEGFAAAGVPLVDSSAILLGTTDFFVARARGEVVLFLRDQIGEDLCKGEKSSQVGKKLLPKSCALLAPAGETTPSSGFVGLPVAFREDLDAFPVNVSALFFEQAVTAEHKAVGCFASLTAGSVHSLITTGPAAGLNSFATQALPALCTPDEPTKNSWQRVQGLAKTSGAFLTRVRALQSSGKSISSLDLARVLTEMRSSTDLADLQWIESQLQSFERVFVLMSRLQGSGRFDVLVAGELLEATLELIGNHLTVLALPELEKARADAIALAKAFGQFSRREYSAAVLGFFAVPSVQLIISDATDSKLKAALIKVARHATTIATIAEAKVPADVEAALEAAAAPLGSWREYRRRKWAGFLGGTLGVGGGVEVPVTGTAKLGGFVGPFLPIGLEMGRSIGDSHFTFNLFFSVLDVGALAHTRVSNATSKDEGAEGQVQSTPELTFASVLSPGVFIELGLGDSPFVLMVGAQYAPANRRFFTCTGVCEKPELELQQAFRFQALLAVDLPVIPVF